MTTRGRSGTPCGCIKLRRLQKKSKFKPAKSIDGAKAHEVRSTMGVKVSTLEKVNVWLAREVRSIQKRSIDSRAFQRHASSLRASRKKQNDARDVWCPGFGC